MSLFNALLSMLPIAFVVRISSSSLYKMWVPSYASHASCASTSHTFSATTLENYHHLSSSSNIGIDIDLIGFSSYLLESLSEALQTTNHATIR